jgi:biotin operon repressor
MKKEFTLEFTNIRHDVRRKSGLLLNEYVLLDMVYHLQVNPKSTNQGWCYMAQDTIGNELGITRQGVSKMIKKLVGLGWLIKDEETKYIKTTEKWYNLYLTNDVNLVAQGVNLVAEGVNSVAQECKLSLHNNNTYTKKDKQYDNITQNSVEELITNEHIETYGNEMINEFLEYWNQPIGNKLRFQKERTFHINGRLSKWFANSKNIPTIISHNKLINDKDKMKAFAMLYPKLNFEMEVKKFYVETKIGREPTSYADYVNHFFNKLKIK